MGIVKDWHGHGHTQRIIEAFGEMFTGIPLVRFKENGTVGEVIREVPVDFNRKSKFWWRGNMQREDDGGLASKGHTVFPRITYDLKDFSYSAERHMQSMQRTIQPFDSGRVVRTMNPVPYDYDFTMKIGGKTVTDVLQIYEMIAPNFKPTCVITIDDYPLIDKTVNIPVRLRGWAFSDNSDGFPEDGSDMVIIEMNFTAEYHLYGSSGSANEVAVKKLLTKNQTAVPDSIQPSVEDLVIKIVPDDELVYNNSSTDGLKYRVSAETGNIELEKS